jgi:chaperone required for assembly of F1-ATPase
MSSEWKAKRFWTEVKIVPEDGGFVIELDGRRVKTPAKAGLTLPTQAMAQAVAAEWDAQQGEVNPLTMPVTRSANAAIDKVAHQHGEVADMLAAYGDSDLLCYRAEAPEELVQRQAAEWNPALDWADEILGVRLSARAGVIHHAQEPGDLARLNMYQMAAFHDLVSLSGSLILGFGAALDWREPDAIWALSQLDERWQVEQWGPDEDAQAMTEIKRQAFLHAKRFYDFS